MCGTKSSHLSHPIDTNPHIPKKKQSQTKYSRLCDITLSILWCRKKKRAGKSNRGKSKGKEIFPHSVLISCSSMFDFSASPSPYIHTHEKRDEGTSEWATHSFIRYNNVVVRYSRKSFNTFSTTPLPLSLLSMLLLLCVAYLRKYVNIWLVPLNSPTFAFCFAIIISLSSSSFLALCACAALKIHEKFVNKLCIGNLLLSVYEWERREDLNQIERTLKSELWSFSAFCRLPQHKLRNGRTHIFAAESWVVSCSKS